MTNINNPNDTWVSFTNGGFAPTTAPWGLNSMGQAVPQAAAPSPIPQPVSPDGWSPKPGSHYFESSNMAHIFNIRRAERQAVYAMEGKAWTEQDEHKLVDKLWRNEYGEPWPGTTSWSYPDLDLDSLEALSVRKHPLQPFKLNYETYAEIKLRLYNTVISIKGHPFLVKAVGGDAPNWKLVVTDGVKTSVVKYSDLTDLRSIPPMYVTQNMPGWLCRAPGRVYQQGMNRQNTSLRSVDSNTLIAHFNPLEFINGFKNRTNRKWEMPHFSLMKTGELPSLRLSDDVAVTTRKGKVIACYKGRPLGAIVENTVKLFDEDDVLQEWIERSAKNVGLELSA